MILYNSAAVMDQSYSPLIMVDQSEAAAATILGPRRGRPLVMITASVQTILHSGEHHQYPDSIIKKSDKL